MLHQAVIREKPWPGSRESQYNGVGGMAIAALLWSYILQGLPATISGHNALAVPIVGVVAAWIQHPQP